MDYNGAKKKLEPGQMAQIASEYGLTEAHVRTVIQVETAGRAYNSVGWPDFLFEPHIYYKNVARSKLAQAETQGLAYPHWKGPGSYPKTPQLRVDQFKRAAALDETAAISSASWGLGQILGSECGEAGYKTPQDMLQAFMDSEEAQVRGMLNLIKHRGLDKDLRNFPSMSACEHFALKYNGKEYAKNNYHVKLQRAYNSLVQSLRTSTDGTIRMGDKGDTVKAMQRKLGIKADGDYGPATMMAVKAWKAAHNLPETTDVSKDDLAKMG